MRKEDGTAGTGKMCYFLDQCQSLDQEQASQGTDMQYETRLCVKLMLKPVFPERQGKNQELIYRRTSQCSLVPPARLHVALPSTEDSCRPGTYPGLLRN